MSDSATDLRWVGQSDTVLLNGAFAALPMVYVRVPRATVRASDPCALDISLPIASTPYRPSRPTELPYWPTYSGLTPGQRRYYLDWLRNECTEWPHELGYVFLYFYGLERRALVDGRDAAAIFGQVLHLRDYYDRFAVPAGHASRSFETYTTAFLWHLLIRFSTVFDLGYVHAVFDQSVGTANEDDLAAVLSWLAAQGLSMPGWLAYELAEILPESRRGVVLRRAGPEHRELFLKRFQEEHPRGMPFEVAKRDRKFLYRPASAALPAMTHVGPNPLGKPSQFARLSAIWNDGVEELKRYSSVVGKSTPGNARTDRSTITIEQWEALPPALRATNEHPLAEAIDSIFNAAKGEHGHAPITVKALAEAHAIEGAKLTIAQSRRIALTVEAAGLAVEPDARIGNKKYAAVDQVVLFQGKPSPQFDAARYLSAAYMMQIGLAIAAADGEIAEPETELLSLHLRTAFELSPAEVKRLEAWKTLLLATDVSPAKVPRPPKTLDARHRIALGQLILAMVAADGVVRPPEVVAARTLFARLGLDVSEVGRTFAGWSRQLADHDLVRVQEARPGTAGEPIPAEPAAPLSAILIDRAAVERIMAETREVAQMLAEAMQTEEDGESEVVVGEIQPVSVAASATASVPPPRYANFYLAVVAQPVWPRETFDAMARRDGHMPSGALEAINDWAFEQFGGTLLYEDGNQVSVELSLLDNRHGKNP